MILSLIPQWYGKETKWPLHVCGWLGVHRVRDLFSSFCYSVVIVLLWRPGQILIWMSSHSAIISLVHWSQIFWGYTHNGIMTNVTMEVKKSAPRCVILGLGLFPYFMPAVAHITFMLHKYVELNMNEKAQCCPEHLAVGKWQNFHFPTLGLRLKVIENERKESWQVRHYGKFIEFRQLIIFGNVIQKVLLLVYFA